MRFVNNYRKNTKRSNPAYLQGYDHFFYANVDRVITETDFADWTLSLWRFGTQVLVSAGSLEKDIISGSDYRFYSTFNLPSLTVDPGTDYYFVVYNTVNQRVKFVSNRFDVITTDNVVNYCLLKFRSSSNIFNFNYDTITEYNSVFLPLNLIEQQPEIDIRNTREFTTGVRRAQKVEVNKVLTIESYYFDDESNDAMLALSAHDDIKINEKVLTVKEAFQIKTSLRNSLQKGTIEFYDQEYSTVNLRG